jgi:hypothetical protein
MVDLIYLLFFLWNIIYWILHEICFFRVKCVHKQEHKEKLIVCARPVHKLPKGNGSKFTKGLVLSQHFWHPRKLQHQSDRIAETFPSKRVDRVDSPTKKKIIKHWGSQNHWLFPMNMASFIVVHSITICQPTTQKSESASQIKSLSLKLSSPLTKHLSHKEHHHNNNNNNPWWEDNQPQEPKQFGKVLLTTLILKNTFTSVKILWSLTFGFACFWVWLFPLM